MRKSINNRPSGHNRRITQVIRNLILTLGLVMFALPAFSIEEITLCHRDAPSVGVRIETDDAPCDPGTYVGIITLVDKSVVDALQLQVDTLEADVNAAPVAEAPLYVYDANDVEVGRHVSGLSVIRFGFPFGITLTSSGQTAGVSVGSGTVWFTDDNCQGTAYVDGALAFGGMRGRDSGRYFAHDPAGSHVSTFDARSYINSSGSCLVWVVSPTNGATGYSQLTEVTSEVTALLGLGLVGPFDIRPRD